MRTHARVALPVLVVAMLLGTSGLSQAQPKAERGRDFAQLMPADPMLYFEMDHKNLTKEFLGLIKDSALSDYAAFRDTLYKKHQLDAGDAGFFDFKQSAIYAFLLAPEFLDELGRMNGHALAITDITETREPKFIWLIDPGTSNIPPLIARAVLTLTGNMKSVRAIDGIRLYQSHYRTVEVDEKGKRKDPKEGKIEPSGPVLASMPGLIVLGSDPDAVADVILRVRGKKVKTPSLADRDDFKAISHLRGKKQMFGYANLKKVYHRTGTFFGFDATVLALEGLLGPESHKDLAAAFWLENNNPHLEFAIHVNPAKTGMLTRLVSSRTIDTGVLHFAPASTFATLTVPVFKDPADWPKLLTAMQKAGRKFSLRANSDGRSSAVSITADGKHAITVNNTFKIWDTQAGREITDSTRPTYYFKDFGPDRVAISPDAKRFVVTSRWEGRPKVFDVAKGNRTHVLGVAKKGDPGVGCAAFSADSKRIVTGEEGRVREWNADNGQELRGTKLHELEKGTAWVLCVCYSPAGDIITGGNDKLVKIWRTDGKIITLKGHAEVINTVSISKNGKRIVSADLGGNIKVWDPDGIELVSFYVAEKKMLRLGHEIECLAISPDGQLLAIVPKQDYLRNEESHPIKLWDLSQDKPKETLTLKGHRASVVSLVITPDGKRIVSGDEEGNLKAWYAADGEELSSMPLTTLDILARRFAAALTVAKAETLAGIRTVTVCVAENPLLIVEMKDAAAAQALVDVAPLLVSKGQSPKKKTNGSHTIHSLPEGKYFLEWPLSYGAEGNIVVFGAVSADVANALAGGVAKRGFAAQPDVGRTLASNKDVNGLLLWSGRNILIGALQADEAQLQQAIKRGLLKKLETDERSNVFERDLLKLYPKQLKKLGADFDKITADLPAGSVSVVAKEEKLTISGSQQGLTKTLPRLIDAWVEWDLTRPAILDNFGPELAESEKQDLNDKEDKK